MARISLASTEMPEEEKGKREKHSDGGGPPAPFAWVAVPREDWESEDNALFDVGLALIRYRLFAIAVFVLVVVLGLLFAMSRPLKYEYVTALRIGQVPVNLEASDAQRPIDSPETILATIQSSLVPRLRSEMAEQESGELPQAPVRAELQQGSSLLSLSMQGTEEQSAACRQLLGRLGGELVSDHRVQANKIRTQLESRLEREKILLEELQDPRLLAVDQNELKRQIKEIEAELAKRNTEAALTESKLERVDERRGLLQNQIDELEGAIRSARENRSRALLEASDGGEAMTILLIDHELRQNQILLNRLKDELEIGLKNQQDELRKRLEDLLQEEEAQRARLVELQSKLRKVELDRERRIAEQQQKIIEMESSLETMSETEVSLPPTRSVRPVGVSRLVLIALSVVAGLALGLMAALGAAFLEKLRLHGAHR